MPRIRLFLKGMDNFKFPKDYDDIFSNIFSKKIDKFIEVESEFENFDFFTFSNFVIEYEKEIDDYLISLKGIVSVVISSISEKFLRKFVAYLVDGNNIYFKGNMLSLYKFEFFEDIIFSSNESNFVTVSPIFLKNFPNDADILPFLENLLISNYCRYYNLSTNAVSCKITTHKDNFQKFIDNENTSKFSNHFYMMDLHIESDNGLISFAYDVGLGNNTYKGFGMLDLY